MLRLSLGLCLVLLSAVAACRTDDSKAGSISCFVPTQYRCREFPEATAEQLANVPGECAGASGDLRRPGKCPSDRFTAKCTVGAGAGREIRRFYIGVDVAQENEACTSMARGLFSREW